MSNGRIKKSVKHLVFLVLVGFLIPVACGKTPLTAPQADGTTDEIYIIGIRSKAAFGLQGGPKIKTNIGPEGGTVEIPGFIRLVIPEGAVAEDEEIEINIKKPNKFEWDLKPHGYQFAVPVELTIFLENADIMDLEEKGNNAGWEFDGDITGIDIYWEVVQNGWMPQGAWYDETENSFRVDLDHFSRYALAVE